MGSGSACMERTGTSRSCPSGPARQVAGRHVVRQLDAVGGLEEFAQLLADVGVPMVPAGQSVRALATGVLPPSSLPRHAADLFASQFDAVTTFSAAAEGCDALVATGMMPAAAGARPVA